MSAFKLKKGDKVVVLAGREKGRKGEIIRMLPADERAIVSGLNKVKRHTRPSAGNPGGIVEGSADPYLQPRHRGPQGRQADSRRFPDPR